MISFCDRELDFLGDIEGQDVLYAGGTSPLWIEGISDRIGANGSLTVLDLDSETLESTRDFFATDDLPLVPRYVTGNVFAPPLQGFTFDLVYSSGLFHELDVTHKPATDALATMSRLLRPGGRLATSDFVNDVAAIQLEDEAMESHAANILHGVNLYDIGGSARLLALHESILHDVKSCVFEPYDLRHLGKLFEAEDVPGDIVSADISERWHRLRRRIEKEGYTRPATMFVEGVILADPA